MRENQADSSTRSVWPKVAGIAVGRRGHKPRDADRLWGLEIAKKHRRNTALTTP